MSLFGGILGEAQVMARLNLVDANVRQQANDAIARAVQATYDGSQADCPVLSGDLKASGAMETHDLGGSVTYSTTHCWYIELGTRKMPAQPFLGPNFLLAEQQLQADCAGIQP